MVVVGTQAHSHRPGAMPTPSRTNRAIGIQDSCTFNGNKCGAQDASQPRCRDRCPTSGNVRAGPSLRRSQIQGEAPLCNSFCNAAPLRGQSPNACRTTDRWKPSDLASCDFACSHEATLAHPFGHDPLLAPRHDRTGVQGACIDAPPVIDILEVAGVAANR